MSACVDSNGILELSVSQGPLKSYDFIDFLNLVDFSWKNQAKKKDAIYIIVCDNARIHRAKMVKEFAKKKKIPILFLSPYSPELNFCEQHILAHKLRLRRIFASLR